MSCSLSSRKMARNNTGMNMAKKLNSYMFLISLILILASACQPQSDSNSQDQDILGVWTGEAQWNCGNGDPAWSTTIEFKSDGSFTATMDIPNLPQSVGNGDWSLSENNVELRFPTTVWNGTVSNDKMQGTFKDDRDPCTGNWSLTKQ